MNEALRRTPHQNKEAIVSYNIVYIDIDVDVQCDNL